MKKNVLIGIALSLSVLLHFGSYVSMYFAPRLKSPDLKPLEVTLLDPDSLKNASSPKTDVKLKQIVEQTKSVNKEISDKAKYLSQFNQKVTKETKAAQTGIYQNSGGQGLAQQKAAAQEEAKKVAPLDEKKVVADQAKGSGAQKNFTVGITQNTDSSAPSAAEAFKPTYDWTKNIRERDHKEEMTATKAGGDGNAVSQTNDFLPDQEKGIQTMLNTREFMYYSYYNRIKHQLNQFWEPKVREKVSSLFQHGRHVASNQDHITKLLIILNAKGTLVDVKVIDASGETSLDEAAIEAFQAAAPFPNPPKGIVEPDGTIKIRWDFILEV